MILKAAFASLFIFQVLGMASIFVTHGGGPYPLLAPQDHALMYQQFQQIEKRYPQPKAIIVFSAHWEEKQWTIIDSDKPPLLFDYYGFPPESYNLSYPVGSSAQLRQHIKQQLFKEGVQLKNTTKRGYDHGVFVPLMIMYPKANVPVIQISILKSLDPEAHFRMGVALRGLKKEGFLILGSGASIHGGFSQPQTAERSKIFDGELASICLGKFQEEKLLDQLKNWKNWKHSKYCHPRQQHLIPLFLNLGVSEGKSKQQMKLVLYGMQLSNFIFQ